MIVAGWADGYRNNSFRTVAALAAAGVPHRLLAGPVGARRPDAPRCPGPRIDLDTELAAWFDRWLRGRGGRTRTRCDVFVRSSTRPAPDLDLHEGWWLRLPSVPPTDAATRATSPGPRSLVVAPDVGTAAWIDCAGHLPWGLSGDQRLDDARSLTWDLDPPARPASSASRGVRLQLVADAAAGVAVGQAVRRLPRRHLRAGHPRARSTWPSATGVHGSPGAAGARARTYDGRGRRSTPAPTPGRPATGSGSASPAPTGPTRRATGAGHAHRAGGSLELPGAWPASFPAPAFTAGAEHSSESAEGVGWEIRDDVLARTTTRGDPTRSPTYATPYDGHAREAYLGEVTVDRRHLRPDRARRHDLRPDLARRRDLGAVGDGRGHLGRRLRRHHRTTARHDDVVVSERSWSERLPR